MSKEELDRIYENAKENSIGPEKKSSAKREKKTVAMKITIGALAAILAISGLTGCVQKTIQPTPNESTSISENIEYKNEYNGYSDVEIGIYERLRLGDLLEANGFTDYTMDGQKKSYNYSAEDFKKIEELDETYLYASYIATTKETFMNILTSLGYENLEDFLIKNEYVDENGKGSIYVWCIKNMEEMSLIMKQATEAKGLTK